MVKRPPTFGDQIWSLLESPGPVFFVSFKFLVVLAGIPGCRHPSSYIEILFFNKNLMCITTIVFMYNISYRDYYI